MLQKVEDNLNKLKATFKEVKELAQGAKEAADKCEVRPDPAAGFGVRL